MKIFRRLSTARLLALIAAIVAVASAASIGSMAAFGSSAQTPPPKSLDQALEDAVSAPTPAGVTARVRFTNNLFPSGALAGMAGSGSSALMSGGSGRLWWGSDGRRSDRAAVRRGRCADPLGPEPAEGLGQFLEHRLHAAAPGTHDRWHRLPGPASDARGHRFLPQAACGGGRCHRTDPRLGRG